MQSAYTLRFSFSLQHNEFGSEQPRVLVCGRLPCREALVLRCRAVLPAFYHAERLKHEFHAQREQRLAPQVPVSPLPLHKHRTLKHCSPAVHLIAEFVDCAAGDGVAEARRPFDRITPTVARKERRILKNGQLMMKGECSQKTRGHASERGPACTAMIAG